MRVEISRIDSVNTYLIYHVLLLPHRVVGLLISTSLDSMFFLEGGIYTSFSLLHIYTPLTITLLSQNNIKHQRLSS